MRCIRDLKKTKVKVSIPSMILWVSMRSVPYCNRWKIIILGAIFGSTLCYTFARRIISKVYIVTIRSHSTSAIANFITSLTRTSHNYQRYCYQ